MVTSPIMKAPGGYESRGVNLFGVKCHVHSYLLPERMEKINELYPKLFKPFGALWGDIKFQAPFPLGRA